MLSIGSTTINNGQDGFSCNPTGNIPLSAAAVGCQINMNELQGALPSIAGQLSSPTGVFANILINLTYNCEEEVSFNIPVNET